ncbi:hypothetical protein SAMN05216532_2811 [Streptomyces sp. 2231.1]|uniref:hypothetical protein n=1 Tax=Streptomyces sp. 2231.1 TaxID=1855347 RepID=UPI000894BBFA|nr:hypothetical protein [Streptomyces sp. 2231.1]SEC92349.1 hypothetical protein SAMN05216532_2811 [Streptomyces sp. 2231.1]
MKDTTTGPGDERHSAGRLTRPRHDERTPDGRTPADPRSEKHLTGEPAPDGSADGRLPGSTGPGGTGTAGDDRAPAAATSPAGDRSADHAARPLPGHGSAHGSEGLRPGTEGLGAETPGKATRTATESVGESTTAPSGVGAPLLADEEADRWEQRMHQVLAGFVEEPRTAVEEADRALEEIAERFTEAVTRRRRTLRTSWQGGERTDGHGPAAAADTEQLRLALRDYRELAGRLLHV